MSKQTFVTAYSLVLFGFGLLAGGALVWLYR
jgi:hypothetical protein